MSKWIDFIENLPPTRRLTLVWRVRAKQTISVKDELGTIGWYPSWRRYVFFSDGEALFDAACLREIADFCEQQTGVHKAAKRAEK